MRHNALFRRFISALTRGGPGGLPRPIEVHAHDPLRYVGDMLGWLHQVWHESIADECSKALLKAVVFFIMVYLFIIQFLFACRPWHLSANLYLFYLIQMHLWILDQLQSNSPITLRTLGRQNLTWCLFLTEFLKECVGHLNLELNKFYNLNQVW